MFIELVMPPNYFILCCPLLLLPSIFPTIRVFSNELDLSIRSFSFSTSPSNEYSGLISFKIDWFDLLAVQGTFKTVFFRTTIWKHQFFSRSAFFLVHFSHPYMTTRKIIALITWIFVGKMMSLTFNLLLRFVIAFLPRSKLTFTLIPCCRLFLIPKYYLITPPMCCVYDSNLVYVIVNVHVSIRHLIIFLLICQRLINMPRVVTKQMWILIFRCRACA